MHEAPGTKIIIIFDPIEIILEETPSIPCPVPGILIDFVL